MPRTLAENATYIKDTIKPAIKSAIEAQGVTVPSTDSFLDYADRIGEIEGGGSGYQLKDLPTGAISTVNDAAELPLNALKVSVEAWQEGSGDPSPSNIRPIHGWSTAIITTDAGVNLLGGSNNWNIDASGKIVSSSSYNTYYAEVEQGKMYKFTETGTSTIVYAFYLTQPAINSVSVDGSRNVRENVDMIAFTAPIDGYVVIRATKNSTSNHKLVRANVYTHTFTDAQGNPLTVYGAEWDAVNGPLDNQYGVVDMGDLTWIRKATNTSGVYRYGTDGISNIAIPTSTSAIADVTCEIYKAGSSDNTYQCNDGVISISSSGVVMVYDERYNGGNDGSALQAALTGYKLKYRLATPTPIDLSPLSIRMLQGTNNLYADCGEVIEGEYFIGSSGAYDLYDYIQTDGTQLIDTGRAITAGDVVDTIFTAISGGSNGAYVWGKYADPYYTALVIYPNNGFYRHYDHATVNDSPVDQTNFTVGKITEDSYTVATTLGGNYTLFDTASVKLYAFSVNGDDYLPCKRRSDSKFGLYDVKNSTFLTDSASGNAIIGGNNLGIRIG